MSEKLPVPFSFASFSQSSTQCIRKFQTSSKASTNSGRTLIPGLCLGGICKRCNQSVWQVLGMGSFDIAEKVRTITCFTCRRRLQSVTAALIYRCQLIGKGEMVKSERETIDEDNYLDPEVSFQHEIQAIDSYMMFGSSQKELIKWYYLKLKSTQKKYCPLNHSLGKYEKTLYDTWRCNNCNKNFESTKKAKGCRSCGYYLCWDCC